MSYRIKAHIGNTEDGYYQIFGNNEWPKDFLEELKVQGASIDGDGCFEDFEVKDINRLLETINKYILQIDKEKKEQNIDIFNLRDLLEPILKGVKPIAEYEEPALECMYIFTAYNFIQHLKKYNAIDIDWDTFVETKKVQYKLTKKIFISGY